MKKSSKVTLTILASLALAGCGRRYDPCDARYFNEVACQNAINSGGYYYNDVWYRSSYGHPYPYYYNSYHTHILLGGSHHSYSTSTYIHSSSSSRSSSSSSVS